MLSTPALTLFSELNEVLVPGLIRGASAGLVWLDCASAEPIVASSAAAKATVALRKKRRRSNSFMEDSSAISLFVRIPSLLAIKPDTSGQKQLDEGIGDTLVSVDATRGVGRCTPVFCRLASWAEAATVTDPQSRLVGPGKASINSSSSTQSCRKPCLLWTEQLRNRSHEGP
jgi:hypothetical protein